MRGKAHDDETRTAAMAALMAGVGVSEVARRYKLPPSTVSRIKANLGGELEQVGTETRGKLDELLLNGLESNLIAQSSITKVAQDARYLRRQSAADLASLYGKLADHSIRLLEAASANRAGEEEDEEEA